jgi:3-oxoacyl-[acyl-carrier-protein] synthase-3
MDGGGIFNFTLDAVPSMMKEILKKNGIEKDDVDYYVFHQANKFMLNTIRKVCVLPKDKFYVNLEETGNTVSSTVLIGLKDCIDKGTICSGMKVMVSGFGVGLSWGGTMLYF